MKARGRTIRAVLAGFACAWLLGASGSPAFAWSQSDSLDLIRKMEQAYGNVQDYQTRLIITGFGSDPAFRKRQTLLYTFKKPNRIRLDFESPHRRMVIIYPDRNGKVVVQPGFLPNLFALQLEPSSSLLEISPGQQINQTDLGLLIRNITHSLTDFFEGDLSVSDEGENLVVRVLSDNPFRRGVSTRYAFFIDRTLWLPVKVEESSARGLLQRTVVYSRLRLNIGVRDTFFRLDHDPSHPEGPG